MTKKITIIKRDGRKVDFDVKKIYNAIERAYEDETAEPEDVLALTNSVVKAVKKIKENEVSVEKIQDIVEDIILKNKKPELAKKYIRYRAKRNQVREASTNLMKLYKDIYYTDAKDMDLKRDNANINGDSSMGIMLKCGAEGNKYFIDNFVLDKRYRDAAKENFIHIHDKDFSLITFNCLTPDTELLIKEDGNIKNVTFDYFDEYLENNKVVDTSADDLFTFENNKWTKVNKIFRRKEDTLFNVLLRNGSMLKMSADHTCILKDGTEKLAKDLKLGEEMQISSLTNLRNNNQKEINLIDKFGPVENIRIYNFGYIRNSLDSKSKTAMYNKLRIESDMADTTLYNSKISLKDYYTIRDLVNIDEHNLKIAVNKARNPIPAILPLDTNMGKFIGYVLAEGYIQKNGMLIFSNNNKLLIDDFEAIINRLFPEIKYSIVNTALNNSTSNCYNITLFSRLIAMLFDGIIAYKHHSNDIKLMDWVYNTSTNFISGILSAEIDGDGVVTNSDRASITSVSKKYILQLQTLSNILGANMRIKIANKAGTHGVINGVEFVRNFDAYAGEFTGNELDNLYKYIKNDMIVYKDITESNNRRELHLGKIVSISVEDYDGYVYDFETESHLFMANGILTHNCAQVDFLKLLRGGFSTGHGYLREPNSIRSYAALACIAIQSNQNDMYGGQSINCWDYAMAEGIRKSFVKLFRKYLKFTYSALHTGNTSEINKFKTIIDEEKEMFKAARYLLPETIKEVKTEFVKKHKEYKDIANKIFSNAYENACAEVEEQTKQAMEAAIANLNSMHSRAGAQTPFSSINYGTDTSPEGRLAIKKTLDAIYEGLGNGETAIFPISVFQIKKGFNYEKTDPNYDLFKYAMKVSAKRLFPNFVNEDAPYNAQYYKPGDYNSLVATMGCRTRVMSNVNGPEISGSRGNFAFTTLNLPKFALEAHGDINKFFEILDDYIYLSKDYLEDRYTIIKNKHVFNYPFLMEQGVWLDSEKLNKNDTIEDVLKHSSISIGFCGLAECLVALIGKHHGESKEAQKLGLKIVGHIREMTDKFTDETHQNWSTFGTPAESTVGEFQRANQRKYGIIKGVTDREYMTNSSHVPVYYKTKAINKIKAEAPYHELENAG